MKSKSAGSKSSKGSSNKTKSPSSVTRLSSKRSELKGSKTSPKLTAVKGAKSAKVTSITSRAVVATKIAVVEKVSIAERLSTSHLVKKAEVVRMKNEVKTVAKTVTLVPKKGPRAPVVTKAPATKISRAEPSTSNSKVITGRFSFDSTSTGPTLVTKGEVVKGGASAVNSAESAMFKVGDKIVYPVHGVGEIEGIRVTTLGGQDHHIYNIKILDSGMKVMVPVSQASTVGLRKIVDKKGIDEVFSILRDRDFKIDTQTWNRRFREYSQKINTGSVFEIAVVLRDLLVLSADKELSFGEKKMLDTAESLLVSEIAIAKSRPHDKVVGELRALFA